MAVIIISPLLYMVPSKEKIVVEKNVAAVSSVCGPSEGRKLFDYFEMARRKYDLTAPFFLEKSLHSARTFLTPKVLKVCKTSRGTLTPLC